MSLKIVSLEAENFKRLRAVQVEPDGNIVTIAGNNGEGKSSLLDAIWVALVGKSVAPPEPIREGEEVCRIDLDLGELRVLRRFTRKDDGDYTDTLKVVDADGLQYPSPQKVLDGLLGHIGFDPFAFVQMKPKDQATALRKLVKLEIDLDALAAEDKRIYATRRDVNRDAKQLESQIAGMPKGERPAVPDVSVLRAELANASEHNSLVERRKAARERAKEDVDRLRQGEDALRDEITRLQARLEVDQKAREELEKKLEEAEALPELIDAAGIAKQLEEADAAAKVAAAFDRKAELEAERTAKVDEADKLTKRLEANEQKRTDALAKAEFPIEGLGFAMVDDEQRVTFKGLPFEQASMAEKLRVSTAIAMAANPKLRVLRIMDGALLDEKSMQLLRDMAAEQDFQLWIERVGTGETGIILENGAIVGQELESKIEAPKRRTKKLAEAEGAQQNETDGAEAAADEPHDPVTGELPPKADLFAEPQRLTQEEFDALSPAKQQFYRNKGLAPLD